MRLMTSVVWLAVFGAVIGLTACSDDGGGVDAGPDGSTDTDGGSDGGSETTCPIHVVGEGGSDVASGSTWAEGLATVERGLDLAEPLGCDVWVKAGTYLPTEDSGGSTTPVVPRTVTFRLRAGVALYGGFAGDETVLEERDIVENETILSGDLGIVDDNLDNSYSVVTGVDGATIDGFTVTDGYAGATGMGQTNGGGMYNYGSSPTVTNCTFSGNSADDAGGGMYNVNTSLPTVTNCTFSDNSAEWGGGGMANSGSSPTVTNCTFSGNTAGSGGGGMYNVNTSLPTVTNCTFSDNSAEWDGGGMANSGSSPTVTNCTFSGNSAGSVGGGMNNFSSSPTVTNCTFSGNSADDYGGGMYNDGTWAQTVPFLSYPAVANCILWGGVIINESGSNAAVTFSDIQGGYEGTGNIDEDPMFVSTTDLHLQSTSPCIDTGSNEAVPDDVTTDLDGNPRIVDGNDDSTATVDMGAYEYQP